MAIEFKDFGGSDGLSSKDFVRLKDKESVQGVFRGNPFDFRQHWIGAKSSPCQGGDCKYCKEGNKPSFRFRMNFLVNENNNWVAKIFEQGFTVYQTLSALNRDDYDLEKYVVKITRNGTGQNTTYSIIPKPNGHITTETESKLALIKLHDLQNFIGNQEQPPMPETPSGPVFEEEDLPF